MADSDHGELVLRVAGGDDVAFARLYELYLPLVLRWSLHATRDRELAADLASVLTSQMALAKIVSGLRILLAQTGAVQVG